MRSLIRNIRRDDEGVGILEVVIAAVVMFFVLTALVGLVMTSTDMNMSAKARAAMTNELSSHIEYVRSLDYDTLESSVIPEFTVDTDDGYEITIKSTIQDGEPGTKVIYIDSTVSRDGFQALTTRNTVVIRDPSEDIVAGIGSPDAPRIAFSSLTPEENTTVYTESVWGGYDLWIEVTAESVVEDGFIAELRFYCQGELLRNGSTIFADVAEWQPGVSPATQSIVWNTEQVNEDDESVILDGWRTVYIIAVDNEGNEGWCERRFYVDNYPPNTPGVPVVTEYDSPNSDMAPDTEFEATWMPASDGTDSASKYQLAIDKQSYSGEWLSVFADGADPITTGYEYAYVVANPFSRYQVSVAAGSPRNMYSDYVSTDQPYVTRPEIWEGHAYTYYEGPLNRRIGHVDVGLYMSEPTFPVDAITYYVYRSDNPTDMGSTPHATSEYSGFYEYIEERVGRKDLTPLYYQMSAVFTPSDTGVEETVWSNIVGPTSAVDQAFVNLEHVSW